VGVVRDTLKKREVRQVGRILGASGVTAVVDMVCIL
jgi:hypothetical protein